MKVAEALAERSDLDKKISQLSQRIKNSARYTEGEEPAEDPVVMLAEARALMLRREILIARINRRNAQTEIEWVLPDTGNATVTVTESITNALALRDRLNAERNLLHEAANAASPEGRDRFYGRRRSELPEKAALPVEMLRTQADKLAKQHRELDALIQQSGWNTDL
jgi:predicted  nucleic acid-binding Zn-ribbon protein